MRQVDGTPGDDRLRGGPHRDRIDGGKGDDVLIGGDGYDRLIGGGGDDRIEGGAGLDDMTGGAGADRFVFAAIADSPDSRPDKIRDFEQGIDKLLFRDEFLEGAPLHFIGQDAFSNTPGEVRYIVAANGRSVVTIDLDGDGLADSSIFFNGQIHFQASDFSF